MPTILETARLALRELTPHDVDNLLQIFGDPEAMRYFPATQTAAETRAWIERNRASYREHGYGMWAATMRDTGAFVGQCGLVQQLDVDGQDEVEVGYTLVRAFWKQGLATEAAEACRDYGFAKCGLTRLVSIIDPANTGSIRVAEKLGMRFEKEIDRWGRRLRLYAMSRPS